VLAANRHPLVIVARDGEKLQAVAAQLRTEYGISVSAFAKDLSDPGAAEGLWSDLSDSNIRIDILVNNAGVGAYGEFQNESLQVLERMQMLNVVALTSLTRLALPQMLVRRYGRILNLASVVAYQPGGPHMAVYIIRFVLLERPGQRTRWFRCIDHSPEPRLNKIVI
jgi:short-subunit dehydrogenase